MPIKIKSCAKPKNLFAAENLTRLPIAKETITGFLSISFMNYKYIIAYMGQSKSVKSRGLKDRFIVGLYDSNGKWDFDKLDQIPGMSKKKDTTERRVTFPAGSMWAQVDVSVEDQVFMTMQGEAVYLAPEEGVAIWDKHNNLLLFYHVKKPIDLAELADLIEDKIKKR